MIARRRARQVLMWSAAAGAVGLVLVWLVTLKYSVMWYSSSRAGRIVALALYAGAVGVGYGNDPAGAAYMPNGWEIEQRTSSMLWWFDIETPTGGWAILAPAWALALPLGVAAAVLFVRDRYRVLPGHCACGYSMAGLAEGAACPECGRAG